MIESYSMISKHLIKYETERLSERKVCGKLETDKELDYLNLKGKDMSLPHSNHIHSVELKDP